MMPGKSPKRSEFKVTYAVHAALRHAIKTRLFAKDSGAKKAAEKQLKLMESEGSIYGRQCRMVRLMIKGATIGQLCKNLDCSRRSVFRYFLDLELAGIDITLDGHTYRAKKGLLALVG